MTRFTLNRHGITHIETTRQAAEALRPLAGRFAATLFTIGNTRLDLKRTCREAVENYLGLAVGWLAMKRPTALCTVSFAVVPTVLAKSTHVYPWHDAQRVTTASRPLSHLQDHRTCHLGGFVGRFHQVLRHTGIAACGRGARLRGVRPTVVVSLWISLMFHALSGQAAAATHHWPVLVLKRLAAPLRSHAFLQMTMSPCEIGSTSCFLPSLPTPARLKFESELAGEDPSRPAILELRTAHRGPLAHHWLELNGRMTIGFGPATLPFIDAGQVSLQDLYGNIERISGMHPLPPLGLPPINYHYARAPGEGRIVGKPIRLTTAQSDALVQRLQHLKFVGPYIPIFHDCRTFVCTVQARGQGHSILPCYLLLRGYW